MARFTQYPAATSPTDYTDATNFLIETPNGDIKLASLEGLSTFFCSAQCLSVTLSSAEILALNTTPIEIIPAQGSGTVIELISAFYKFNYLTTPYATNTDLYLRNGGTTGTQATLSGALAQNDSTPTKMIIKSTGTTTKDMPENQPLNAYVPSGNPTAGDSPLEIFVYYRVVTT